MRKTIPVLIAVLALSAAARAEEVVLTTGEVLKGKVAERTDATVVLEHPVLGRLEIPASGVKEVRPDTPPPPPAPKPPVPRAERAPDSWKFQIEAGLNGTSGNTHTQDLHAGFLGKQEEPESAWKADARFDEGKVDGDLVKSHFSSGLRRDWLPKNTKWFYFGEGRYERDQFTPWDQRATLAAGMGYRWIETESLNTKLRFGAAGTKEWGSGDESEHVRPEGLLGVDLTWKPWHGHEITAASTYYPDLTDRPEYRLVSSVGWNIRLDEPAGISLRFAVEHEMDTHREAPFKKQDTRYLMLFIFDL
jgi:putative salt-induced outer membrane protein YdiY